MHPHFLYFWLLTLVLASSFGLLAIWAATSSLPVWVRCGGVALSLSLFLSVSAHEPTLFFLLQVMIVVIGISWWRRRQQTEPDVTSNTYSLQSLLLLTVLAALTLAVFVRTKVSTISVWFDLVCCASVCGVVTLGAAWLSLCRPFRWKRLMSVVSLGFLVALPSTVTDSLLWHFPQRQMTGRPGAIEASKYFCSLGLLLATTLVLATLLRLVIATRSTNRMIKLCSISVFAVLLMAIVAPSVAVYSRMPSPQPRTTAEASNGYSKLAEAAKEYKGNLTQLYSRTATEQQIAIQIKQNESLLRNIHSSLDLPIVVPTQDDSAAWQSFSRDGGVIGMLLRAEATQAFRQSRIDVALESSLALMKWGRGLTTAESIHVTNEGVQTQLTAHLILCQLVPKLSVEQLQSIAMELEMSRRPSFMEIQEQDRQFQFRTRGWPMRLQYAMSPALFKRTTLRFHPQHVWDDCLVMRRLLAADVAIRLFKQKQGRLPSRLEELEMDADAITDPHSDSGELIKYKTDGDDKFLVYSIGIDKDDDGGKVLNTDGLSDDGDLLISSFLASYGKNFGVYREESGAGSTADVDSRSSPSPGPPSIAP